MGMINYLNKAPTRLRLLRGEVPAWIANRPRNRYIAQIILSAPPWVWPTYRGELLGLQSRAVWESEMNGELHVLDHIIPINHPQVCGLTVPWNLRVIPWRVNASKGNTWCPEQQELFE